MHQGMRMDQEKIKKRLKELQELLDEGLINQADYDQEKQVALSSFRNIENTVQKTTKPAATYGWELLYDGQEIGAAACRFILIKRVGSGTYGQVWKALDLTEQKLLGGKPIKALKFLHPQYKEHPEYIEDLQKEAIQSSQLNHPHIVNITRFAEGPDGWAYIVMEYLHGESLDRVLRKQKTLSFEKTLQLFIPVAEALDYAHKKKLCHRDLKPANLHLNQGNELKIVDFGLAYRLRRTASQTGIDTRKLKPSGTIEYMAPETFYRHVPKVEQDIHAFACVIYECLAGEPPFSEFKAPVRRDDDPLPPKPECLTEKAWKALQKGFSIDAKQRPSNASELLQQLIVAQKNPLLDRPLISVWSIKKVKQWQQQIADELQQSVHFQDNLKSGGKAPPMVVIPNGSFLMGSPSDEPEREYWDKDNEAQHKVEIAVFSIGKTPVTFAEYNVYCQHTGKSIPNDRNWGKGQRPVINVSWHDAIAYAQWLSEQTGRTYRLATEAEWEYACRAGTTSPFHFGNTITQQQANFNGDYRYNGSKKGQYLEKTTEVGVYPANAFGLHDMHGNVWEWTCSSYETQYKGKELICATADCSDRVFRGGSWLNTPRNLRSAYRSRDTPDYRGNYLGFRLATGQD